MIHVSESGQKLSVSLRVGHEVELSVCYRHSADNKLRSKDVFFERTDNCNEFPTSLVVTLCQQSVIKYLKFQECNLKGFKQPFDFLAHALTCNFVSESEIEQASEQVSFNLFAPYESNLVGAQSTVKSDTAHSQKTIETLKAKLIKKQKKD